MKVPVLQKKQASFPIQDSAGFKTQALSWAAQFDTFCYLDNNQHKADPYHSAETMIAIGAASEIATFAKDKNAFAQLQTFYETHKYWLFGFLTYDLKNEVEALKSENFDGLGFPQLHFFQAQTLIRFEKEKVIIESQEDPQQIFQEIQKWDIPTSANAQKAVHLQARMPRADYIETVEKIRQHIIEGDVYELNLCQEFFAEDCEIDPISLFIALNAVGKAPFSACYKIEDQYLLCGSPERFMKKSGTQLLSQPIKGTIARGNNAEEDAQRKEELRRSEKDRAENVMIVDLVRNDLARSCLAGTVKVEELFGIHPFSQVWHMISTITGTLRPDLHFIEAIRNAFPMGSMTGAPKVLAMELIEHYEKSKRGLYSGAVGYITPEGDFDFNVVIRSLFYHADRKYLSFQVGGAIVYDSTPEKEYEECLLKAKAMLEVLKTMID